MTHMQSCRFANQTYCFNFFRFSLPSQSSDLKVPTILNLVDSHVTHEIELSLLKIIFLRKEDPPLAIKPLILNIFLQILRTDQFINVLRALGERNW